MLSSQTKDKQTYEAVQRLRKHGLTVDNMIETEKKDLEELLYGVGFYRRKAEYIKKTAVMIRDKHEGVVPSDLKQILKFPGVGMKMAILLQQSAFGIIEGICVDTHVHRIWNNFNWVESKNPEETRVQLQDWLPKSKWQVINHMLVGFGQTICKPVAPLWNQCSISDSCPVAFWYGPKKIEYEEESSDFNPPEEEDKNVEKEFSDLKLKTKEGTETLRSSKRISENLRKIKRKTQDMNEPPTLDEMEESNIRIRKKRTR